MDEETYLSLAVSTGPPERPTQIAEHAEHSLGSPYLAVSSGAWRGLKQLLP